MNVPNMNYKVVLITSLLFVVIGIVLMFGFPWFLHKKIRGVSMAATAKWFFFFKKDALSPNVDRIDCPFCLKLNAQQVNVAPGSSLRGFYEKAPVGLDFRVIVFNVTNKDDVIRGSEFSEMLFRSGWDWPVLVSNRISYFHSLFTSRKAQIRRGWPILFRVSHDCFVFFSLAFLLTSIVISQRMWMRSKRSSAKWTDPILAIFRSRIAEESGRKNSI